MQLQPPSGGIDYLPTGGSGLSSAIGILARLFEAIQTSVISIGLFVALLGFVFYVYSNRQQTRGLQLVEGGVITLAAAAFGAPILSEATAYVASGQTAPGAVQLQDGVSIEVTALDALNTTPKYPVARSSLDVSLGPTVAIFGNILSVLMLVAVSAGISITLFALILYVASPQRRRGYAQRLLRGGIIVTVCVSTIHLVIGAISWVAVGSPSVDRGSRPVALSADGADPSQYYDKITLPHEAMTPEVVYPVSPGDATVIPTLELADRLVVLNEVTLAYVAVIAFVFGLILYVAGRGISAQQKATGRKYIVVGIVLLVVLASTSLVVTAVGWVATGDGSTESTIYQPGAPYADGTTFSSGSVEGWNSTSGQPLIAVDVDGGGMGLTVAENDTVTRPFDVADTPGGGDQVLVSVKTSGTATVTVLESGTPIIDAEGVNGTTSWTTRTEADTLTIRVANAESGETLLIESVIVTPVYVEDAE